MPSKGTGNEPVIKTASEGQNSTVDGRLRDFITSYCVFGKAWVEMISLCFENSNKGKQPEKVTRGSNGDFPREAGTGKRASRKACLMDVVWQALAGFPVCRSFLLLNIFL